MHEYWAYGLAVITIILLIVAAALIAVEDNDDDKRRRRVRFDLPARSADGVRLPLDFGAL